MNKIRTQEIGNIEPRWTGITNRRKVVLTFRKFTGIYQLSSSEKDKLIKEGNNVAARLVDSKDDSTVIVSS